jgi:hypothetical protein
MDDKSASRFVSMLSPVNQSRQSLAIQPVDPDDGMYHWVFKNIDFRYWEKGTSTKALWVSGAAGLNFKGISRQIAEMQLPKTSKNDKYGLHFCCSEKTDFEFLAHTFMHRIFQKSPASTIILAKLVSTSLMDSYWQDRAIEPLDVSNKREILQSDSLDAVLTEMLGLREDYMAKALGTLISHERHNIQLVVVDELGYPREKQPRFHHSLRLLLDHLQSEAPEIRVLLTGEMHHDIRMTLRGVSLIEHDRERAGMLASFFNPTMLIVLSLFIKSSL